MLDQIARHGGFSIELECDGDLYIDPHHSIEDCAIALGQLSAVRLVTSGIGRYGFLLPMDESLVKVALDFEGGFTSISKPLRRMSVIFHVIWFRMSSIRLPNICRLICILRSCLLTPSHGRSLFQRVWSRLTSGDPY